MRSKLLTSIVVVSCGFTCGCLQAPAAGAAELPDGRVYELVTPTSGYEIEAYQPIERLEQERAGGLAATYSDTQTELPFQAAANGEGLAFVGSPSEGGNENSGYLGGNEYLATHLSGGGWAVRNLSPDNLPSADFEAFSSDLSVGFLDSIEPLSADAPRASEKFSYGGDYDVLYSTSTAGGGYTPLFTVVPPYRSRMDFRTFVFGTAEKMRVPGSNGGSGGGRADNGRVLVFAGASADSAHALFLANDALTGAEEGRPAAEGGSAASYEKENNLYESFDGQLRLVNVLPGGTTEANATFGGGAPFFQRVISANGSRVFWTDLTTGHIYMREDATRSVEISAAGAYQTATADGSAVFYTNGDLYEYEVESGHTTDLTPGVKVEKVVGTSEDGQYVYYVTSSGEFDLWHDGATVTISHEGVTRGEVTPDGRSVVFSSFDSSEARANGLGGRIEVYDAETGALYCASCTSRGVGGILPFTNEENVYQPRWISDDGGAVFFDSYQALAPQDTNGEPDVYEWERPGKGQCSDSEGCVHLLSGGTSTQGSFLLDASESGDDVFFVTRAQLLAADRNELYDVYDARVDGYTPIAAPACSGSGCQGVPGAPPIFATPSSVTFAGVGNFEEEPAPGKPKKKQQKKKARKKAKRRRHKANGRKHRAKAKHKHVTGKSKGKQSARGAHGHGGAGAKGERS